MPSEQPFEFAPDYAVPPGEYLLEQLLRSGMSQAELATRIDRPLKTINEIVKGKAAITPETALQLERATNVPAEVWNTLEAAYQLRVACEKDSEKLLEYADWLKQLPVRELKRLQVFPDSDDPLTLIRAALQFFGIGSPQALASSSTLAAFRESPAFPNDDFSVCAWLRIGEKAAHEISCEPYDKERFLHALGDIRLLTRSADLAQLRSTIVEECRRAGVAVAFVPELKGTHVSGAARWLSSDKALIQLSCRYKTDDHFWFTFFHEAGHLLLHRKKAGFLDTQNPIVELQEEEANEFAATQLIPRPRMISLCQEKHISVERIKQFAEEVGVSPGIVLGQLQKRRRLPYLTQLNKLKRSGFDLN